MSAGPAMSVQRPPAVAPSAAVGPLPAAAAASGAASGGDTPFARLLSAQGAEAAERAPGDPTAPAAEDRAAALPADPDEHVVADPAMAGWIVGLQPPAPPRAEAASGPAHDESLAGVATTEGADAARPALGRGGRAPGASRADASDVPRAAPAAEPMAEDVARAAGVAVPEASGTRAPALEPSAGGDALAPVLPTPASRPEAAAPPAPVALEVSTPVSAPEFREALAVQVSVLARDGVQQAELHLNPADLGPISVQIALDGTRAQVEFGAASPATRQAIEAGLPQLAAALRDAGFTLAGGGVSQHARGQPDAQEPPQRGTRVGRGARLDDTGDAPRRVSVRVAPGRVDLYA